MESYKEIYNKCKKDYNNLCINQLGGDEKTKLIFLILVLFIIQQTSKDNYNLLAEAVIIQRMLVYLVTKVLQNK